MKIVNGQEVLEDGESVNVRMVMMDAAGRLIPPVMHRPGFVQLTNAEKLTRERLYRDHDQNLSKRWKDSPLKVGPGETVNATGDERLNAYQRYQERVSNAWRHR